MKKKVLVITSSLRPGSNSDKLAEAFARGAAEAGNEVETVSLKGKELRFCIGCLSCQKSRKCVLADDAPAIVEKMHAADDDPHTPERALGGLGGWIECFEKARLAGSVFAGGVDKAGDIAGHEALEAAYEMGKRC